MRIYLVRHGQSTHNANHDVPHDPDPPLTALGREQARRAAEAMVAEAPGATALYASPQRRALETVAALQSALDLPARILADLCESGGLYEHAGMTRAEIIRQWPGVEPDDAIGEQGWWPAGEREADETTVYARAQRALARLTAVHGPSRDTIVVVTHGRFCGVFVSAMLGLGPAGYTRFPMENCAFSRIDFDAFTSVAAYLPPDGRAAPSDLTAVRLRYHNRVSHMPPGLVT